MNIKRYTYSSICFSSIYFLTNQWQLCSGIYCLLIYGIWGLLDDRKHCPLFSTLELSHHSDEQDNLFNRSHTSQDTCLISEKQLSCSHEFARLLKDWPCWGPQGWPRVHTCPLSRTSRFYEAGGPCCHDKDLRRGMGTWTMAHVISTANVQPACLSLLFSPSCSLCLSFLKHTQNVLLFEWETSSLLA